jgi:hypothetical protein
MTTVNEMISQQANQSQVSNFYNDKVGIVSARSYEGGAPINDGVTDASSVLNQAIEDSKGKFGILIIPPGIYSLKNQLINTSGLILHGCGIGNTQNSEQEGSKPTILKRDANIIAIKNEGESYTYDYGRDTKGHLTHIQFRDIYFDCGNYSEDFMQLINISYFQLNNCYFKSANSSQTNGRQLLLWEAWDSRIVNTDFTHGGKSDGSIPFLELRAEDGDDAQNPVYENTNNIYFAGCRFEWYHTGFESTGGDSSHVNHIYFNNCKLESENCLNAPHFDFKNTNRIGFNNVLLASKKTLTKVANFDTCTAVTGHIDLQYFKDTNIDISSVPFHANNPKAFDISIYCAIYSGGEFLPSYYWNITYDSEEARYIRTNSFRIYPHSDQISAYKWKPATNKQIPIAYGDIIHDFRSNSQPTYGVYPKGSFITYTGVDDGYPFGLHCTVAGEANTNPWQPNTVYGVDARVGNDGKVYKCNVGGTSDSSIGPTGTNPSIDGTVTWQYVNTLSVFLPVGQIGYRTYGNNPNTIKDPRQIGEELLAVDKVWYKSIGIANTDWHPMNNIVVDSLPTAGTAYRGVIATLMGGDGVADTAYVCIKKTDDTYEWITII